MKKLFLFTLMFQSMQLFSAHDNQNPNNNKSRQVQFLEQDMERDEEVRPFRNEDFALDNPRRRWAMIPTDFEVFPETNHDTNPPSEDDLLNTAFIEDEESDNSLDFSPIEMLDSANRYLHDRNEGDDKNNRDSF